MTTYSRPERGLVLVGVDGSATGRRALHFAVEEARRRHATLLVVTSVHLPDVAWLDPYAVSDNPEAQLLTGAEERLRATVAEETGGAAEPPVEVVVTATAPAPALIDRSADADLLVVGSRGRGGFRGLVLGSVSMQCVLHAHCPVTVVHAEPAERAAAAETAAAHHRTVAASAQETSAPVL